MVEVLTRMFRSFERTESMATRAALTQWKQVAIYLRLVELMKSELEREQENTTANIRKAAARTMTKCLNQMINVVLAQAWNKWFGDMEEAKRAGEIMQRCLKRIVNMAIAPAFGQWRDAAKYMARRAGMVMKQCMDRFVSSQFVGAWNKWLEVMEAEKRAGQVMLGTLNRICNSRYAQAWNSWRDVIASEKRAGLVMSRCLAR